MKTIELIIDRDCPNVVDAREELRRALAELELPLEWQEWDRVYVDPDSGVRGAPSADMIRAALI